MNNENLTLTKQNNTKTILAMICIIVLFLILLFITFSYFTSSRRLVISDIEKLYEKITNLETNMASNIISNNNVLELKGTTDIEITGEDEIFDSLKNINLEYSYIENKEDSKASIDFNSTVNNEEFITLEGLIKNDTYYINPKNLINKYYYIQSTFEPIFKQMSNEDLTYLGDIVKETLISNVTKDKFTKTNEEITLNGKTIKSNKVTFNFDDNLINKVLTEIVNKIKADDKALTIIASQMDIETEDLKTYFDEMLDSIDTGSNNTYSYSIYVQNYVKTVKRQIDLGDIVVEYYENGDESNIKFIEEAQDLVTLTINSKTKKINGNLMNTMDIEGSYTDNSLKLTINYFTYDINLDITTEEKLENADSYKLTTNLNIGIVSSNEELLNIKVTSLNTLSKADKISGKDVNKAVDYNNISEADQQVIMEKFMNLPVIKTLMGEQETEEVITY